MCSRLVKLLTCMIHFRSQSLLPKKVASITRDVQVASWRRRTSRPTPQVIPAPIAPTTHRGRPRSHQSRPSPRMTRPTDVPLMLQSLLNPTSLISSSTATRSLELRPCLEFALFGCDPGRLAFKLIWCRDDIEFISKVTHFRYELGSRFNSAYLRSLNTL